MALTFALSMVSNYIRRNAVLLSAKLLLDSEVIAGTMSQISLTV